MNKESKLNLNAGDYAISHCDSDKTYTGLEVHKMLCDAYIAGNNDTLESEDERVRKELIKHLKELSDWKEDEVIPVKNPSYYQQWASWLEKQEEHANFRNKIQVGDKVTRNEDGVLVNLSQLKRVAKPADTVEPKFKVGDKIYLKPEYRMPNDDTPIANTVKEIRRIDDKHYRFDGSYIFIEDQDKYELVEQNPAWSEEDERLCQCLIEDQEEFLNRVSNDKYGHSEIISDLKEMYHERIDWLKSLRPQNTYNPYKAVVESIAEMCKHYDKASHSGLRDFYDNVKVKCKDAQEYDSLYPQSRWKPSELQLGCLSDAIEYYNSFGYPASKLKELLDDLKKLKEG